VGPAPAALPHRAAQLALILRLAGEFQGFARDLHDEAIEHEILSPAASRTRRFTR
jgi:hypothetical protein